jgi:hypothetical protein
MIEKRRSVNGSDNIPATNDLYESDGLLGTGRVFALLD